MGKIRSFIKLLLSSIFRKETEYTKKWMARFTVIVFTLLLFYPFLSQELLYLHLTYGLDAGLCKAFFSNYTKFVVVLITGYAVTFIGQMGKAFMAKKEEENNKLKKQLSKLKESVSDEEREDEVSD